MIARPCPRCHTRLEFEDSALVFCFHCGAPQVLLSQELQELAEQQQSPGAPEGVPVAAPAMDPATIQWQPMLRLAAMVSSIFGLFSFLLPLSLFAPAITLALYTARYRQARITSQLGARIGLLCGLIVASLSAAVGAVTSLVARLRSPGNTAFDDAFAAQITQFRDQLTAQHAPDVAGTTAFLNIPEFRAGVMLAAAAMMIAFFLIVITGAGALAGFARSRTPRSATL